MLRWCRAPLVALCAGGLVLSIGCSTLVVTTGVARARVATAAAKPAIAWHDCDDGFRCGTLAVPLDDSSPRADPTGSASTWP